MNRFSWPGIFKESKKVNLKENDIIPIYLFSKKKFINCSQDYIDNQQDVIEEIKKLKWDQLQRWMIQNNADFALKP